MNDAIFLFFLPLLPSIIPKSDDLSVIIARISKIRSKNVKEKK